MRLESRIINLEENIMGQNREQEKGIIAGKAKEQNPILTKRGRVGLEAGELDQQKSKIAVPPAKKARLANLDKVPIELLEPVALETDQSSNQEEDSSSEDRSPSSSNNEEQGKEIAIESSSSQIELIKQEKIQLAQKKTSLEEGKTKIEQELEDVMRRAQELEEQEQLMIKEQVKEAKVQSNHAEEKDQLTGNKVVDVEIEADEEEEVSLNSYDITLNDDNVKNALEDALIKRPNAVKLDLFYDEITSNGVDVILDFLSENKQITRFDIDGNPIGAQGVKKIADFMKGNDSLETLSLSNTGLDLDSLTYLMEALSENRHLKTIYLSGNHFGDQGAEIIFENIGKTSVKVIGLGANDITFEGARYLDTLTVKGSNLKEISLIVNHIEAKGLEHLAKFLGNNPTIMELDLLDNDSLPEEAHKYFPDLESKVKFFYEDSEEEEVEFLGESDSE